MNARDEQLQTPLLEAAWFNRIQVMKTLLQNGTSTKEDIDKFATNIVYCKGFHVWFEQCGLTHHVSYLKVPM